MFVHVIRMFEMTATTPRDCLLIQVNVIVMKFPNYIVSSCLVQEVMSALVL